MIEILVYGLGGFLLTLAFSMDWISLEIAVSILAIAIFLNRFEIVVRKQDMQENIALITEKITAISKRIWPDG